MKVKDLIKLLSEQDPESVVVMSRDPEGNGFRELYDLETNAKWHAKDKETSVRVLTPKLIRCGFSEEDLRDGGVPAIVLYPG